MNVAFKRLIALIATPLILPISVGLAIAEDNPAADKAKTETDAAQATAGLVKFAREIEKYGKAQQDPIALISAVRMLKESGAKEVAPDEGSAAPKPVADVIKEWLDEARKLAQESDKNKAEILALADEAGKKEIKTRGWYSRHVVYHYHPTCW